MDFIKKVYSICCYTNAQSEVYGTDIIPMVCHNGNIDLEKTVQNVEQVCKYFRMDPSKAKQITASSPGEPRERADHFPDVFDMIQGMESIRNANDQWTWVLMDPSSSMTH